METPSYLDFIYFNQHYFKKKKKEERKKRISFVMMNTLKTVKEPVIP